MAAVGVLIDLLRGLRFFPTYSFEFRYVVCGQKPVLETDNVEVMAK